MGANYRITIQQAIEIHLRANAGEPHRQLAIEYGCHSKTIWRYRHEKLADLKARANSEGVTLPDMPQEQAKPKVLPHPKARMEPAQQPQSPLPPVRRLSDHDSKVRRGDIHVTRECSYIQTDASDRIVRVLSCPVYGERWNMVRRGDIDVVELHGTEGRGVLTQWCGETIHGTLRLTRRGKEITRVEFHPETLPQAYRDETEALRARFAGKAGCERGKGSV